MTTTNPYAALVEAAKPVVAALGPHYVNPNPDPFDGPDLRYVSAQELLRLKNAIANLPAQLPAEEPKATSATCHPEMTVAEWKRDAELLNTTLERVCEEKSQAEVRSRSWELKARRQAERIRKLEQQVLCLKGDVRKKRQEKHEAINALKERHHGQQESEASASAGSPKGAAEQVAPCGQATDGTSRARLERQPELGAVDAARASAPPAEEPDAIAKVREYVATRLDLINQDAKTRFDTGLIHRGSALHDVLRFIDEMGLAKQPPPSDAKQDAGLREAIMPLVAKHKDDCPYCDELRDKVRDILSCSADAPAAPRTREQAMEEENDRLANLVNLAHAELDKAGIPQGALDERVRAAIKATSTIREKWHIVDRDRQQAEAELKACRAKLEELENEPGFASHEVLEQLAAVTKERDEARAQLAKVKEALG